jgi:hypothetical protein
LDRAAIQRAGMDRKDTKGFETTKEIFKTVDK